MVRRSGVVVASLLVSLAGAQEQQPVAWGTRVPQLATGLSVVFPGIGQVYNGQVGKGVGMGALALGGGVAALVGFQMNFPNGFGGGEPTPTNKAIADGLTVTGFSVGAGAWLWSVVDAAVVARRSDVSGGPPADSPIGALALSAALPGLGQLSNGEYTKAAIQFVVGSAADAGTLSMHLLPTAVAYVAMAASVGVRIWSAVDGYKSAQALRLGASGGIRIEPPMLSLHTERLPDCSMMTRYDARLVTVRF